MTVKPSRPSRSAMAAPMPRDAPVTVATLLDWLVISLLLDKTADWQRRSDGRNLGHSIFRIMMHYLASQSGFSEQRWTVSRRCGCLPGWWSGGALRRQRKI